MSRQSVEEVIFFLLYLNIWHPYLPQCSMLKAAILDSQDVVQFRAGVEVSKSQRRDYLLYSDCIAVIVIVAIICYSIFAVPDISSPTGKETLARAE